MDVSRLIDIVAALRDPGTGCSWNLRQTHDSLSPYVLEEAHEVVDAIERNDRSDLRDELGDLLLQVVLHARLAEEDGAFAFGDVVEAVSAKMIRRHPHVFPASRDQPGSSFGGLVRTRESWDAIKAEERLTKGRGRGATTGLLDDLTIALPGLTRAVKLQTRASTVGFDWPDAEAVLAKIDEEVREVSQARVTPASTRNRRFVAPMPNSSVVSATSRKPCVRRGDLCRLPPWRRWKTCGARPRDQASDQAPSSADKWEPGDVQPSRRLHPATMKSRTECPVTS